MKDVKLVVLIFQVEYVNENAFIEERFVHPNEAFQKPRCESFK